MVVEMMGMMLTMSIMMMIKMIKIMTIVLVMILINDCNDYDKDNWEGQLVMMRITARGKETKRERKVQAVKVIAVTPSTNA